MPTESPKYSRDEVSNKETRESHVKGIQQEKSEGKLNYDKKTPEGRLALSRVWLERVKLSPAQKDAILEEIIGDLDIDDDSNAAQIDKKVTDWQKENLGGGDGVIGPRTIEKADMKLEQADMGGTETGEDGYGLNRVAAQEARDARRVEALKDPNSPEYKSAMKTLLAGDRSRELIDPAGNRLSIVDGVVHAQIDGTDKTYDEKGEKWETTDEKNARIAKENPNSIESIKTKLANVKSIEEAAGLVEGISIELSEADMNSINTLLAEKGFKIVNKNPGSEYYAYTLVDTKKEKTPGTSEYTQELKKIAESTGDVGTASGQKGPDGTPLYLVKKLTGGKVAGIADGNGNVYNFQENKWQMPEEWAQVEKKDKALHDPASPEYKDHMDEISGRILASGADSVDESEIPDGVIRDPNNSERFIKNNQEHGTTEEWVVNKGWQETASSKAPNEIRSLAQRAEKLGNRGMNNLVLGNYALKDIRSAIDQVYSDQAATTGDELRKIQEQYNSLSTEDQQALGDMSILEFAELSKKEGDESEFSAVAKLIPEIGKFKKLPAKFGKPNYEYAQASNHNVFRKNKGNMEVYTENKKFENIRTVYTKTGEYPLPNGMELRVSLDGGKKVWQVAESAGQEKPKWVLNNNGGLDEIQKTA